MKKKALYKSDVLAPFILKLKQIEIRETMCVWVCGRVVTWSDTMPKPDASRPRALQNKFKHTFYSIIAPTLLARANERLRCQALK